jgi:predicted DNA-binding transcriptional regulator
MCSDRRLRASDIGFAFFLSSGESGIALCEMFRQGLLERGVILINVGAKGFQGGRDFGL